MREIKFKYLIKRKNNHIFSKIFTLKEIEFGAALKWIESNHAIEKEVFKLQYIGLKDRNGKEIYEDDILEQDGQRAIVTWFEMKGYILACWSRKDMESEKECLYFIGDKCEVVGSIHYDSDKKT